jgi:hypothetical protein
MQSDSTCRHPAVVGFLHRNCRYKSVFTRIHYDFGLAPISYTGPKFIPHREIFSAACTQGEVELHADNKCIIMNEEYIHQREGDDNECNIMKEHDFHVHDEMWNSTLITSVIL